MEEKKRNSEDKSIDQLIKKREAENAALQKLLKALREKLKLR
ncbi:hypothetical protein V6R21_07875 [Limibacter armeniacum]